MQEIPHLKTLDVNRLDLFCTKSSLRETSEIHEQTQLVVEIVS